MHEFKALGEPPKREAFKQWIKTRRAISPKLHRAINAEQKSGSRMTSEAAGVTEEEKATAVVRVDCEGATED